MSKILLLSARGTEALVGLHVRCTSTYPPVSNGATCAVDRLVWIAFIYNSPRVFTCTHRTRRLAATRVDSTRAQVFRPQNRSTRIRILPSQELFAAELPAYMPSPGRFLVAALEGVCMINGRMHVCASVYSFTIRPPCVPAPSRACVRSAVIGEVDEVEDSNKDLSTIMAEPLKPVTH